MPRLDGNAYSEISLLLDLIQVSFAYALVFSLCLPLIVSNHATNKWSLFTMNSSFLCSPLDNLYKMQCNDYLCGKGKEKKSKNTPS